MKVYYNIPQKEPMKVSGQLGNKELEDFIDERLKTIADKSYEHICHKWKYRIMWELRHFEEEMNIEGGVAIIESKGWRCKGFLEDLTYKLIEALKSIDENVW